MFSFLSAPGIKGIDPDNFTIRFVNNYGRDIPYYDDGMGVIYVASNTSGPDRFIRAMSESDAYDIWRDESPTIPVDELYMAYGFDSQAEFDACENRDEIDLIEGYEYQSNSSGTGIVDIDLNGEQLTPVTLEWLAAHEITLEITASTDWRSR